MRLLSDSQLMQSLPVVAGAGAGPPAVPLLATPPAFVSRQSLMEATSNFGTCACNGRVANAIGIIHCTRSILIFRGIGVGFIQHQHVDRSRFDGFQLKPQLLDSREDRRMIARKRQKRSVAPLTPPGCPLPEDSVNTVPFGGGATTGSNDRSYAYSPGCTVASMTGT